MAVVRESGIYHHPEVPVLLGDEEETAKRSHLAPEREKSTFPKALEKGETERPRGTKTLVPKRRDDSTRVVVVFGQGGVGAPKQGGILEHPCNLGRRDLRDFSRGEAALEDFQFRHLKGLYNLRLIRVQVANLQQISDRLRVGRARRARTRSVQQSLEIIEHTGLHGRCGCASTSSTCRHKQPRRRPATEGGTPTPVERTDYPSKSQLAGIKQVSARTKNTASIKTQTTVGQWQRKDVPMTLSFNNGSEGKPARRIMRRALLRRATSRPFPCRPSRAFQRWPLPLTTGGAA